MFTRSFPNALAARATLLIAILLVQFATVVETLAAELTSEEMELLAPDARLLVRHRAAGALGTDTHGKSRQFEVIKLGKAHRVQTLRELRSRPDIEFVAVERRKHRHAIPNDANFGDQWYLHSAQPAALAADLAWDTTTGSAGIVIAVIDTGVRFDHPDLARAAQAGKLLPGYDFISADEGSTTQFLTANDGDGRDADPTDPGDWVDGNDHDKSFFSKCDIENSSWHGTRVAGLIAANTNNGIGISGTSWQSWILPIRALGKCGGYDGDILSAMRWAGGLSVAGVPDNPYPAKIINLSLGSEGTCRAPYLSVVQELAQIGVVVVASAGNGGGPVDEPANCAGVVAVAGLRHAGTKVGYSSLGSEVSIAAPAGNCVNTAGPCLFSLATTIDIGRTTPGGPGYTDQFTTNLGTSFSAPLAAGVAALMQSVNARLTPSHVLARLKEGARAFPDGGATPPPTCHVPVDATDLQLAECVCTTTTCGAGMLNAQGAVAAALRPIASIVPPVTVAPGITIVLDGSTSTAACGRSIASFQWTVVSAQSTATPTLSNAGQATVQVVTPSSGSFTLRLTVTDDQGAADTGDITVDNMTANSFTTKPIAGDACPVAITVQPDPPSRPPSAAPPQMQSSGRGGGGAFNFFWLIELLMLAAYRLRPSSICRNS